MTTYRDTCPQRKIVTVHHTIQTWLPVTLECGHREEINWTARVGSVIGCTKCAMGCGLFAVRGDVYCNGCRSAVEVSTDWEA